MDIPANYNTSGVTTYDSLTVFVPYSRAARMVTFDANGGTVTVNGVQRSSTSREVRNGAKLGTLPTASRGDEYIFLGWYTAKTGGNKITQDTTVSRNVTYYAHWEADIVPTLTPPPTSHGTSITKTPASERTVTGTYATASAAAPSSATVRGTFAATLSGASLSGTDIGILAPASTDTERGILMLTSAGTDHCTLTGSSTDTDAGSSKFSAAVSSQTACITVPAGADVYGIVKAPAYRAEYTYRTVTGQKRYTITYTYTYDYSSPYTRKSGRIVPRIVTDVGPLTFTVDVVRDYSYTEVTGTTAEYLTGATLTNGALAGAISLARSDSCGFSLSVTASHLTEPSFTSVVNLGNIGTKTSEFYLDPAAYVADAESRVGQIRCASDSLSFGGTTLLSSTYADRKGAAPLAVPAAPPVTLSGSKQTVPLSVPNGSYISEALSAAATYRQVRRTYSGTSSAPSSSVETTVTVRFTPANGIRVHTPATCYATISADNDRYVQTEDYVPSDGTTVNVVLNPGITVGGRPASYGQETAVFNLSVNSEASYTYVRFGCNVSVRAVSPNGAGNRAITPDRAGAVLAHGTWYRITTGTTYSFEVDPDQAEAAYPVDLISLNYLAYADTGTASAQNALTAEFENDSAYQTNAGGDKNAARDTKYLRVSGSISRFTANGRPTSELPLMAGSDQTWSNLGSLVRGDVCDVSFRVGGSVVAEAGATVAVRPTLYVMNDDGSRREADMYVIERTGGTMRLVKRETCELMGEVRRSPASGVSSSADTVQYTATFTIPQEFYICPHGTDVYAALEAADYTGGTEDVFSSEPVLILHLDIELLRRADGTGLPYMTYANEDNAARGAGNMWRLEGFCEEQTDSSGRRFALYPGDIAVIDTGRSVSGAAVTQHLFY